jgi:hypothetical protein
MTKKSNSKPSARKDIENSDVLEIRILGFGIVSDFDIRISDLSVTPKFLSA